MSTCIITTWIIQLVVGLTAAAEFLKPGWGPPGWVFWCISCVYMESETAAGWKSLWRTCDPIHPQSTASFGVGWAHARPDSQVFSIYKEWQIHSLPGPLFQFLTTLLEKNVFLKPNCNCKLYFLAALSLCTSDKSWLQCPYCSSSASRKLNRSVLSLLCSR